MKEPPKRTDTKNAIFRAIIQVSRNETAARRLKRAEDWRKRNRPAAKTVSRCGRGLETAEEREDCWQRMKRLLERLETGDYWRGRRCGKDFDGRCGRLRASGCGRGRGCERCNYCWTAGAEEDAGCCLQK
ncbi:hypothetical protein KSP39_PZI018172 [Platanthera zijinensis]|uniref:Uncharacterized protein n=1 Tax=Platanthera zijinensis TaxID=2320716 RepID=A0AAP0B2W9_9ASPA